MNDAKPKRLYANFIPAKAASTTLAETNDEPPKKRITFDPETEKRLAAARLDNSLVVLPNGEIRERRLPETPYVRIRGMPTWCQDSDIRRFFAGCTVEKVIQNKPRPGEGYAEFYSKEICQKGYSDFHKKELLIPGKETVILEVFNITSEHLSSMRRRGFTNDSGRIMKMTGLPSDATQEDVKKFLEGVEFDVFALEKTGQIYTGVALLRMLTKADVIKAMTYSGKLMGKTKSRVQVRLTPHREWNAAQMSIGLTPPEEPVKKQRRPFPRHPGHKGYVPPPSSYTIDLSYLSGTEAMSAAMEYNGEHGEEDRQQPAVYGDRRISVPHDPVGHVPFEVSTVPPPPPPLPPAPPVQTPKCYRRGGGFGEEWRVSPRKLLMRGIPFRIGSNEIRQFFQPFACAEIRMGHEADGRLSGEATVEFGTDSDATEALRTRNKKKMDSRTVRLFRSSEIEKVSVSSFFDKIYGTIVRAPLPETSPIPLPTPTVSSFEKYSATVPTVASYDNYAFAYQEALKPEATAVYADPFVSFVSDDASPPRPVPSPEQFVPPVRADPSFSSVGGYGRGAGSNSPPPGVNPAYDAFMGVDVSNISWTDNAPKMVPPPDCAPFASTRDTREEYGSYSAPTAEKVPPDYSGYSDHSTSVGRIDQYSAYAAPSRSDAFSSGRDQSVGYSGRPAAVSYVEDYGNWTTGRERDGGDQSVSRSVAANNVEDYGNCNWTTGREKEYGDQSVSRSVAANNVEDYGNCNWTTGREKEYGDQSVSRSVAANNVEDYGNCNWTTGREKEYGDQSVSHSVRSVAANNVEDYGNWTTGREGGAAYSSPLGYGGSGVVRERREFSTPSPNSFLRGDYCSYPTFPSKTRASTFAAGRDHSTQFGNRGETRQGEDYSAYSAAITGTQPQQRTGAQGYQPANWF